MNHFSEKKRREAKELLIEAMQETGGPGGPAATESRVEAIINLIVEAAVEEACEKIKKSGGPTRRS